MEEYRANVYHLVHMVASIITSVIILKFPLYRMQN